METAALRWLERQPLLHVCMTECIRRAHAEILFAGEDGVLLRDASAEVIQLSTESPERLESWLPLLGQSDFDVIAHQDFALPILDGALADRPFRTHCYHSVYTQKKPLPAVLAEGVCIAPLDKRWSDVAEREYAHGSAGYITERIEAGVMLGAFIGGELAGFIGQHPEGAQGLLHVLPAYRRMGLARALMAANLNAALDRGEVPFGQIETHNEPSLALSRSMGLAISQEVTHWFFR